MRYLIPTLFILTLCVPVFGHEADTLEDLIQMTEKNLTTQKNLLKAIREYEEKQAAFLKDSNSGKLATQLVRSASHVYKQIEKEHLQHLFSPDFLRDLRFFYEIGQKQLAQS